MISQLIFVAIAGVFIGMKLGVSTERQYWIECGHNDCLYFHNGHSFAVTVLS